MSDENNNKCSIWEFLFVAIVFGVPIVTVVVLFLAMAILSGLRGGG